jgi:transposase
MECQAVRGLGMTRRYALRDDQWARIEYLLPGSKETVGVAARDNRLFVDAVLYRYRAGIPWRDLPEHFEAWKAVHTRFSRWTETGVWESLFKPLADDADERMIVPAMAAGMAIVIPAKRNHRIKRVYDRHLYKSRHLIENVFAKLKQFRPILSNAVSHASDSPAVSPLASRKQPKTIWPSPPPQPSCDFAKCSYNLGLNPAAKL